MKKRSSKHSKSEEVKSNIIKLVETLLCIAKEEIKISDSTLKEAVQVNMSGNQLKVTGNHEKTKKGVLLPIDSREIGTTKEDLIKVLEYCSSELDLPKRKVDSSLTSDSKRKLSMLQSVFTCLKEMEIFQDQRPPSSKKQRYWKFTLNFDHQNREDIINEINHKWEKYTNKEAFKKSQKSSESVSSKPPYKIPVSTVKEFFGRDEKLEELHQKLQESQRVSIKAAISGMGGVGKTELAIQYAWKQVDEEGYPGGICVFQIADADLGTQVVQFARSAPQLNIKLPKDYDLAAQVKHCWLNWIPGKVLVILDNVVTDVNFQEYLPPADDPRFKVLITTRKNFNLPGSVRLDLDVLKPKAALNLLISLVGRERIKQEPWIARKLCRWLGYLPLGLELVGRYLARDEDWSLAEVFEELKKNSLDSKALTKVPSEIEMRYRNGVSAAFRLSWKILEKTPESRDLGRFLSLFALSSISWSLVELAVGDEQAKLFKESRSDLLELNLIKRIDKNTYQVHQLVREFLKEELESLPEAQQDDFKQRFCHAMAIQADAIPETFNPEQDDSFNNIIPHVNEAAQSLTQSIEDHDLIKIFGGLGNYYKVQGDYNNAELRLDNGLFLCKIRFEEEHLDTAQIKHRLAEILTLKSQYEQAEALYLEALKTRQKLLGEKNIDTVSSIDGLGLVYLDQGKYEQAEANFLKALRFAREILQKEEYDICAEIMSHLAYVYRIQGKLDEAEPLCLESLQLRKKINGEEHSNFATGLHELGMLYKHQGKYKEAEELFDKVVKLDEKLLGENHPDTAMSLGSLAAVYWDLGKLEEAENLNLQVLELTKKLLGEDNLAITSTLNNLAGIYQVQGRYSEAESLYLQLIEIDKKLTGEDHPNFALDLYSLAVVYHDQKKYQEAESLYLKSLKIFENNFGKIHRRIARNLTGLALLYHQQERYQEAESLCLEAKEIYEEVLGSQHPDFAFSIYSLSKIYHSLGRYEQAISLNLQAIEIANQALGESHATTIKFKKGLEEIIEKQKNQ